MQPIVLLIVLLCFQVELAMSRPLYNFAAQDGHVSRSVERFRPIVPAEAP